MQFDATVNLGHIITIAGFLGGGWLFVISMRGELKMLAKDVHAQGHQIEKLSAIVTDQAVTRQRLTNIEGDVRDMKHGRGFVTEGRESLNREYP